MKSEKPSLPKATGSTCLVFEVLNVNYQPAPNGRSFSFVSIRWSGWNEALLKIDYFSPLTDPWFAHQKMTVNQNDRFALLVLKASIYARITFVGIHWIYVTTIIIYDITVQIRHDGSGTLSEWRHIA